MGSKKSPRVPNLKGHSVSTLIMCKICNKVVKEAKSCVEKAEPSFLPPTPCFACSSLTRVGLQQSKVIGLWFWACQMHWCSQISPKIPSLVSVSRSFFPESVITPSLNSSYCGVWGFFLVTLYIIGV